MEYDLSDLPEDVLKEHLELTERLKEIQDVEASKDNFLNFVKSQWPQFISGAHHKKMAEAFDRIVKGKIKRLTCLRVTLRVSLLVITSPLT